MATDSFDQPRHPGSPLQSPFSPRIAVFASQDANDACKKNNLQSFVHLLRPFEYIDRVSVRHANYSTTVLDSLRLSFLNADQLKTDLESKQEDETGWLNDLLHRAIFTHRNIASWNECRSSRTTSTANSSVMSSMKVKREHEWLGSTEEENEDYPQPSTPWYMAFLNLLLEYRPLVEYDYTSHPLAAMIVVSTNNPEPLNEFSKLYEKSGKDGSGWPKKNWFETGTILRYYLLVHEINDEPDGGRAGANELLDSIKRAYGLNCGLVCINSERTEWLRKKRLVDQDPNFINPDLNKLNQKEDHWSKYQLDGSDHTDSSNTQCGELISEEDVLGLKVLLRELTLQSLVPHMERCIQQWNDSLSASRKGITGRLFSVGKKYFSKVPGSGSSSPSLEYGYNPITYSYPHQSQEAQTRRLADFSFMLGDYKFASQTYDYLRKDAFNDKAWTYYSSATQMIGLCTLLQSSFNQRSMLNVNLERFLFDHILATPSVGQLKMVMVYYEMAKAVGNAHSMSSSLIRIAVVFNEIISGLIYEQVSRIVSPRQASLYIVLASHRYYLAQQTWLSKICLRQCPQFNGWTGLEDYLDDQIAQIAELQADWSVATIRYWNMITRRIQSGGVDTAHQEDEDRAYMEKFRTAFNHAVAANLPLSLPGTDTLSIFDAERCKIHIPHQTHLQPTSGTDPEIWNQLISRCPGASNLLNLSSSSLNTAIVNEPFYLVLFLRNPLHTSVKLTHLDIKVIPLGSSDLSHEDLLSHLQITPQEDHELLPLETREISVELRCSKSSIKFEITEVMFKFDSLIECSQRLKKRGKRLQQTLTQRLGRVYSEDQSMVVHLREPVPILELVGSGNLPSEVYHAESVFLTKDLTIRNSGQVGMKNLQCLISDGNFFRFCPADLAHQVDETSALYETADVSTGDQMMIKTPNHILEGSPTLLAEDLEVGATMRAPMVCRGEEVGQHITYWLFVFQHATSGEFLCYRHVQHLNVLPSLKITPHIQPSLGPHGFYLLNLELDCSEVPEEIEITQVSTTSTHWRSESLNLNPTESSSTLLRIPKQSSSTTNLVFEVVPVDDPPPEHPSTQIMLQQLRKILKKEKVDPSQTSLSTVQSHVFSIQPVGRPMFRMDSPAILSTLLAARRHSRRKTLQEQFTTLTPAEITSIFPLTSLRSMEVIIFWKTQDWSRSGHFLLSEPIRFGALRDILANTLAIVKDKAGGIFNQSQSLQKLFLSQLLASDFGQSSDPVFVHLSTATGQSFFDWDFAANGPLTVPVTFTLKNVSPSWMIEYELELISAPEGEPTQQAQTSRRESEHERGKKPVYGGAGGLGGAMAGHWVGRLKYGGKLGRLERHAVHAKCWILGPGSVTLGRWVVHAKYCAGPPDPTDPLAIPPAASPAWVQVGPPSSFISVADASVTP